MAGYCTSGQMYLHEPKASENAAYECNIQPFFTFTSAIITHFSLHCDIVRLHERLFNPPVLDLKARHSVVFIFSVIYILYCFYLSCSTSYLGVVGGWGLGGGGGGWGCSVRGRTSYFFIFDSFFNFFTLWRPLFLTSPCLQVFIRGKTSMVPLF